MVERKKEVIYVPYWIVRALQLNNLPMSTILDYRKVAEFLSPQEQANMLLFESFNPFKPKMVDDRYVPDYGVMEVGTHTSITESPFNAPLYDAWCKQLANSPDANDNALFKNLQTMNALSWAKTATQEIDMRYDPANSGRLPHNEPFITYDVEREFIFVVVYPGFFNTQTHNTNVINLCKAVLEILYAYNTPASGCKTPYFRKYLESLV